MSVSTKGNGYDPVAAVVGAVEKTGWTPEQFFSNARIFNRQGGIRPAEATAEFYARATLTEFPHMTAPAMVAFADWVLIKGPRHIERKFETSRR